MFRYITLVWPPLDDGASNVVRGVGRLLRNSHRKWEQTLDSAGLVVYSADRHGLTNDTYLLGNNSGVVLGKLFQTPTETLTNDPAHHATIDSHAAMKIVGSEGRYLLDHYWGRYVAFIRSNLSERTYVVRDPQGGLPCLFTTFQRVRFFFSNIQDCIDLGLMQFSIDWHYVSAFVCYPALTTRDTGLNEVSEVTPGECVQVGSDSNITRVLYWDPCSIAQSKTIESPDKALAMMRDVTRYCVWSWASCHPSLLHALSGGLDSSIVLSCLASSPTHPEIACINYFNGDGGIEDERPFARMIAAQTGSKLFEVEERAANIRLEGILQVAPAVKPTDFQASVRHSQFEGQLAKERNATAIFCGVGGDQIFYQGPVIFGLVDYLLGHGPRSEFFRLAAGFARAHGFSLWKVVATALRLAYWRQRWSPLDDINKYQSLVRRDIKEIAIRDRDLIHPWMQNRDGVAEGKAHHVQMMALSTDPYDPFGRDDHPEPIAPLVSQPLVELCLRIPTHILVTGGIDRAIARRAFSELLPPRIVRRSHKGGIDEHLADVFRANLGFLREVLLDGLLMKNGLLDREKVERALAPGQIRAGPEVGELLCDHLNTEAWLRTWTEVRQRQGVEIGVAAQATSC